MANAGPDTNSSQFYILFASQPHLDGKHVVFGQVEAGWETLLDMEEAGSQDGAPNMPVEIVDCGALPLDVNPQDVVQQQAQQQQAKQQGHQDGLGDAVMAEQQSS